MTTFKVIEIINAWTIKIDQKVKMISSTGNEIISDRIRITGMTSFIDDVYVIRRLESLIKGKQVKLAYPVDNSLMDFRTPIACRVFLDNTDIVYYFPDHRGLIPTLG